MPSKSSKSGVQFFPGQAAAIRDNVFNAGGIFDDFLAGKPSTGLERATSVGLQQLQRQQAQSGLAGTVLATRQNQDFLNRTAQAQDDDFFNRLFSFMQPAGSQSTGGRPGLVAQMIGKG